MKHGITLIVIVALFSSCSSLKKIQPNENQPIRNFEELELINGVYSLDRNQPCLGSGLNGAFEFKADFDCINKPDSTHFMRLTALNEKQILAELYQGNQFLEKKILKGKFSKNYFTLDTSLKFPVFYVVFNIYRSRKTRIGILPNGNLTVDS